MRPEAVVPRVAGRDARGALDDATWSRTPALALARAQDGAAPVQQTAVRIAHDADALLLRFECADRDIWATHVRRDAPLWEEEVVEVFIAPGDRDPVEYVEVQVNPLGTIFDARVSNPHGRRNSMRVDAAWNATGLVAAVLRPSPGTWRVEIVLPWRDLCVGAPPPVWRANFFRVDRPREGDAEFCSWSPTLADPPDFHRPAFFGRLVFEAFGRRP